VFHIGQMRSRIDAYEAEVRRVRAEIRERAVRPTSWAAAERGSGLFVSDGPSRPW